MRRRDDEFVSQSLDRVATILLKIGLDSPAAEKVLREAFIRAALRSCTSEKQRPTQSQVASLAGVSRREVRKLFATHSQKRNVGYSPNSRIAKLLEGWKNDGLFCARKGVPRPLEHRGATSEFALLVRKYGSDITKKTFRVQLLKSGLAKEYQGKLALTRKAAMVQRDTAASADLEFVAAQLTSIDFELGKRRYASRRISISTTERKSAEAMRQIAVARLGTVLNSLKSMSVEARTKKNPKQTSTHRLLISTTIAVEKGELE
jgi:hypothetical protein